MVEKQTGEVRATHRLHLEDGVLGIGVVGQARHPAELLVQEVQHGGGVVHAFLEAPEEGAVALGQALSHGQGLLQLLLQGSFQGLFP